MNVAIIPARGGSKRIIDKNIKTFVGQPIIAYSIQAAVSTGVFDHVIVTTDSEKIAEIARSYGATVPFSRPLNLADDHTPTASVLQHAIQWFVEQGSSPVYACCLYATAPFVQPKYLLQGLHIMQETRCSTCYAVTSFPFPILRGLKIDAMGEISMFWPEYELVRSQDLPEAYHDAGQFYWVDCAQFVRTPRLYSADARPVLLPRYLVQDIDTPEDWTRAEVMYQRLDEK